MPDRLPQFAQARSSPASLAGERGPTRRAGHTRPARPRPLHDLLHIDGGTARPIYQQLEDQIAALIDSGVLEAGTTLPAERQLAKEMSLSRTTVQRCYNGLRERKLLGAYGRLGSIVQEKPEPLTTGMDRLKGFTEEMRELGRVPSSRVLEQRIGPSPEMAAVFGAPESTVFLKLVRVRSGDGVPMSHEVAWYNLDVAPGLARRDLSQSIYAHLRGEGVGLTDCQQTIEARMPSALDLAIFGTEGPIPCLLIKRRSFAANRVMVEYVEGLFRGDAYTYRLNLRI